MTKPHIEHLPTEIEAIITQFQPRVLEKLPSGDQYSQVILSHGLDLIFNNETDHAIFGYVGSLRDIFYKDGKKRLEMASSRLRLLAVLTDIKQGLLNLNRLVKWGEVTLPHLIIAQTSEAFLSRLFNFLPQSEAHVTIYPPGGPHQEFRLSIPEKKDFLNDIPAQLRRHVSYVHEVMIPTDESGSQFLDEQLHTVFLPHIHSLIDSISEVWFFAVLFGLTAAPLTTKTSSHMLQLHT